MNRLIAFLVFSLLPGTSLLAAEQVAATGTTSTLLQALFGFAVVLGLMAGAAWVLKRMGVASTGGDNVARVVSGVSVGNRERVLVIEVADQWIVIGVAPGRVNALATMPKQEIAPDSPLRQDAGNFAAWLKQTIDKRNGGK